MREAWDGSERAYGRFSVREFLRTMPPVSRAVLIATLAAFLVQLILFHLLKQADYNAKVIQIFGLLPASVLSRHLRLWQLVSYLFLHSIDNPLHILFNMFVFAMFAPEVERAMAAKRFALLYFTCGVFAAALTCVLTPRSTIPVVGASGAILGVLAAFGSLFPKRVVYVFLVLPMKAKHCMFLLAGLEVFSVFVGNPDSPVATVAHIGGFIAGFLFIRYEWTVRSMLLRSIERHYDREQESDRQIRERVDDLLDKVAREGIGGLSWREHSFLKRASKRFKKHHAREVGQKSGRER
ncbi:MAG TPA: rhomboid family intramembrane serine protease [Planctomycetota bacterium]|nr:rhomboid family intramembrane serine protease [Planctomycetota bacterium]